MLQTSSAHEVFSIVVKVVFVSFSTFRHGICYNPALIILLVLR